ncbi:hypothetical protein [Bradyrhizobium neotropicale]|uniref:hypothetical protein n=1 Tax=Bradyrhizobium neotropicale TaxID=1497615 RepID=UPI001AD614D2|nr:hypothetical protein [Bradyrhizobium neotropicale]MBO4226497.1 hypothetical protein [Bradyrhizobium neotropicale]
MAEAAQDELAAVAEQIERELRGDAYVVTCGKLCAIDDTIASIDADDFATDREVERSEAIHSAASGGMDCFAEPVIQRAFARPVGSQ